jgi:hypothetical protein
MAKISPELEQQFRAKPGETVDLIVRTQGEATPHLDWLAAAGLQVKQQFKLVPGVAISGSGQNALQLLNQDWVMSVELDAPVTTM